MRAVNLTTAPVELDPVNGPGTLAPAVDGSDGAHERELVKTTDRERGLAEAGVIALEGEEATDRYDGMEREALQAEADERGVTAERADGRTDLSPLAEELRAALRLADVDPDEDGGKS